LAIKLIERRGAARTKQIRMRRDLTYVPVKKELEIIKLSKRSSRGQTVTVLKDGTVCLL